MKPMLCAAMILMIISACGTDPSVTLKRGYDASSFVVKSSTILVDRDQMSVPDAQNVSALAKVSKSVLDKGANAYEACKKADPKAKCNDATLNINLGAGVFEQLEAYLKAREAP